jgi:DNA (cytosine-5)-methyltransferase 1
VLLASPECTNHSLAKGARGGSRRPRRCSTTGPGNDDEQDRSRATMWDVVRFAEQKLLKGKPYKAIVVENVVDAYRWGADDDGGLFAAWRQALTRSATSRRSSG